MNPVSFFVRGTSGSHSVARMRARLVLLVVLTLGGSACGGGEPDSAVSAAPTTVTAREAVPAESTPTAPTTVDSTTVPTSASDRPPAPNFTLTLHDGTDYQLDHEVRPVYLVFWAEW